MIVGLVGPSCSGKSFLLGVLQSELGFTVPKGITTRSAREKDNGDLEHITRNEFQRRQCRGMLSMIAEVFGNSYAYPRLEINGLDIAIEIVKENIPELRLCRGIAVKVIPYNLDDGIGRIVQMRKDRTKERIAEFVTECLDTDSLCFDLVFRNKYNDESRLEFIGLIKGLRS